MNSTLTLDVTDDLSYRIFGRNRDIHMNMIGAQMAFQNQALPLTSQFANRFAKLLPDTAIENFSTTFWYPNNVILAVPYRMT